MIPAVSAWIPSFNNAATLARALESIRAQTLPVAELFVVDDGSTDESVGVAEQLGVRVVRHEQNLGRGAARARAMREARHDLTLCCDAGNALEPDFLERALPSFDDPRVAAVCGRFSGGGERGVADRWRSRHLFKVSTPLPMSRRAGLLTGGAVLHKTRCEAVGGFDHALRHSEDADLGRR